MKQTDWVVLVIFVLSLIGVAVAYSFVSSPYEESNDPAMGRSGDGANDDLAMSASGSWTPVGPDNNCANCHLPEMEAWELSAHATSFRHRHRSAEAKEMLHRLGRRSMKRDDLCISCHYTALPNEKRGARWGVSCESCHGPASEWMAIHNRPGGDTNTRAMRWGRSRSRESETVRTLRLNHARKRGMVHSGMTLELNARCFDCHYVRNEELVNKGGHGQGEGFDLLSWSQGEVRHGYLNSPGSPNDPINRLASSEHRRQLYVLGILLEVKYGLEALRVVSEPNGEYFRTVVARFKNARKNAEAILKVADLPELRELVGKLPDQDEESPEIGKDLIVSAAGVIRRFMERSTFPVEIDALLPTVVKGKVLDGEEDLAN